MFCVTEQNSALDTKKLQKRVTDNIKGVYA